MADAAKRPEDADTRIAPDPLAAVLPAIAALSAVASIATVQWVAQEKTPERGRAPRKAQAALRDLESCCVGLRDVFKRFHTSPRLFAGEGGAASAPLKFGMYGARVGPQAARLYQQLINDIASMLVLATQNAFAVMAAIEDGEIEPPEALLYRFGDIQEKLNGILTERPPLKETVDRATVLAVQLVELVEELKTHRVG